MTIIITAALDLKVIEPLEKRSPFLWDATEPPPGRGTYRKVSEQYRIGEVTEVADPQLPTYCTSLNDRNLLTGFGVQFVTPCDIENWFSKVTLPGGWKIKVKRAWHYLLDEKDRLRAEYLYDHELRCGVTHFNVRPRYSILRSYPCDAEGKYISPQMNIFPVRYAVVVLDSETVIHQSPARISAADFIADERTAAEWLYKNFPRWWDKTAYWD